MSSLASFIRASDRVIEFHSYLTDIPQDEHTIHTLEIQKEEILHLWTVLRLAYDAVMENSSSLGKDVTIESIKGKYFSAYNTHLKGLSKISELLDSLRKQSSAASSTLNSHIHLPPCDIDDFYGDYSAWPSFRDQFSGLYGAQEKVAPVEKLCHLLKKTKGEAHEIVRSCPFTNAGFAMAWQSLLDRYENKRVLIHAQLKILFNLTPISKENGPSLKTLQRTINNCKANLSLLEVDTSHWDVIFVYVCSTCLSDTTLNLWEQSLHSGSQLPTWQEMDTFLTTRFHTLESVTDIRSTADTSNPGTKHFNKINDNPRKGKKVNTFHTNVNAIKGIQCTLCSDSHPIRLCPKFLQMSIDERFSTVKSQKRCTNCLATSHDFKKCKSQYVCSLCKQKHHSLLHRNNAKSSSADTFASSNAGVSEPQSTISLDNQPSTSASAMRSLQTYSTQLQSTKYFSILLGTALVDLCIGGTRSTVRALIDPASEASFISKALQNKFSLRCTTTKTEILGLNGARTATSDRVCTITIASPLHKRFETQINVLVVQKLTGQLPYHSLTSFIQSGFSDLQMADVNLHKGSHVDLLLGGDIYPQILQEGVRWTEDRSLVAQNTIFGWIITGKISPTVTSPIISSFYTEITLDKQVRLFWELEEIPDRHRMSADDEYCEELFKATTSRNESGRFVVSLPFRKDFPQAKTLGLSRDLALSQYLRNENRLSKLPEKKLKYDEVIREYLSLSHMISVPPTAKFNETSSYYLPHHAVLKPDSTTTKLRVVFNASHPTTNGVSLNDVLYPGPVLQADLTILILRWRLFKYVFSADIEKMYRQILVNPKHTPYQRIIFRSEPQENPSDYELQTVTFGVNCAPYLAIRTLHQLANECEKSNPVVADILRNYMYVDDILYGASSLPHALKTRNQLTEVLSSAGFSLRKWTANHKTLLQELPPEHLLNENFLKLSESSNTKTLGLRWNAERDVFYFNPQSFPDRNSITKREVLSEIAKLFDPAGWLAPKVIVAKIIMQQIWRDKTNWDEALKPPTLHQWHAFLDDYLYIKSIEIPRFVNFDSSYLVELHGFCDASEKAYAATLYLRAETPSGVVFSHLLLAKTKVAPLKFITLPRKELCGAELMAKMINSVQSQLSIIPYHCFLWTDSTIVLSWLQKPPYTWTTFVANRVASIIEKVDSNAWSHVDSKDNPADLASRGTTAKELAASFLWWYGPHWLKCDRSKWPPTSRKFDTDEESRPVRAHVSQLDESDILCRFSDLPRAMRVLSYMFRFFHAISPKHRRNRTYFTSKLTHAEVGFVRSRLIKLCQRIYFPEYDLLSKGSPLPQKSNLLSLNPIIDRDGIMRVNGRLAHTPTLSYNERFPKILPYNARFTRLYLEFLHNCSIHGTNSLLIRLMRLEFWVPKLKNIAKLTVHKCKTCVLQRRLRSQQLMASLPPERTTLSRPFTNTGVDFAGPFDIKSFAGRGCKTTKGYVLVFVCFATKAIHLEVTSDLSTSAFLAAFARFFSRRGSPKAIYSDNGTAFVGAANILNHDREDFFLQLRQKVMLLNAFQPVEWHFIPPGAPHMGGLWEAGVKSFKIHLKKVSHAQSFTYEEFSTMLARIEACLNSRPLTSMSNDPNDLSALTPGHFLIGGPLLSPPEPDNSYQSLGYQNRWKKLQVMHHVLALRWKEEYLKELHKRVKWKYPHKDFAPGDLVVIRQDNFPPTKWRLGRIEKVYHGKDSRVRVAEIRTESGLVVRPIVKLVLLPISEQH